MDRYRVTLTPDGRVFGILDRDQYEFCGLPDEEGRPKRLEFPAREAAERWLNLCYRRWRAWEGEPKRRELVPLRWRPLPAEPPPGPDFWRC
ncbi:hypothetical protein [Streptomyces griseoaurantiacus]|uniref:hypothetical protein n=1 Tax=Streptomyces griseoaurantiacus TaxID=68213 RepID=UPI0030E29683